MGRRNTHPLDAARDAAIDMITRIAERAVRVYATCDVRADLTTIKMDLMACHFKAQKLRLDDLLAADDFNLLHDVGGINRHLNRDTIQLENCFRPRFSAK